MLAFITLKARLTGSKFREFDVEIPLLPKSVWLRAVYFFVSFDLKSRQTYS
jgi:hypothetical protein